MESIQIISDLRIRKFVPLDRVYPILEVLMDDEVILDISRDNNRNLEIAFHDGISNKVMPVSKLLEIVEECKTMLDKQDK